MPLDELGLCLSFLQLKEEDVFASQASHNLQQSDLVATTSGPQNAKDLLNFPHLQELYLFAFSCGILHQYKLPFLLAYAFDDLWEIKEYLMELPLNVLELEKNLQLECGLGQLQEKHCLHSNNPLGHSYKYWCFPK